MRNLIRKNPRYSKRINYDALRDLFDGGFGEEEEQKIDLDNGMYTMDGEQDEEMGAVVVEEGGGGVGMGEKAAKAVVDEVADVDEDADAEGEGDEDIYGEGDEGGGDWDVYEQEV